MDAAGDQRLQSALGLVAVGGLVASGYLAAQGAALALCGLVINAALLVGVLLPGASGPRFGVLAAGVGAGFSAWLVLAGAGGAGVAPLAGLAAMALALGLSALRLAGPTPRPEHLPGPARGPARRR